MLNAVKQFFKWLGEGARTALFMAPRWEGLKTNAGVLAALLILLALEQILLHRLYILGPATFYWQAIAYHWLGTLLLIWCGYLVRGGHVATRAPAAPDAASLITLLLAQCVALNLLAGGFFAAMLHLELDAAQHLGSWGPWLIWLLPVLFVLLAQRQLLWRGGLRKRWSIQLAMLALVGNVVLNVQIEQPDFWYADEQEEAEAPRWLKLTQEVMETQAALLPQQAAALRPQRPGQTDLYALTFAPYDADVFRRESAVVADVMASRFGAEGRTLQLLNHMETAGLRPWATSLNLRRGIAQMARVMDRDEDVLFIHLTSHGARDGEMASHFSPLTLDQLKPAQLKQWLDEAGIRHRVISVSACYSGSWIKPLEDDNTLVMTAADAEHTSFGCGRRSELTYFGRAMYDEQLRTQTLSFEQAHSAARTAILKREQEGGKDDGYSNPQISVGKNIRARLERLTQDSKR